jgi:hypothetical protein
MIALETFLSSRRCVRPYGHDELGKIFYNDISLPLPLHYAHGCKSRIVRLVQQRHMFTASSSLVTSLSPLSSVLLLLRATLFGSTRLLGLNTVLAVVLS